MARVEVITGPERRRRWSDEQKRAIVAESFRPGAIVSEVARRAEISAGQIYRWRQELLPTGQARGLKVHVAAGFAPVLISPPESAVTNAEDGATSCAEPAIEVEVGKARVRIPGSIPAALAAAVVKALSRR